MKLHRSYNFEAAHFLPYVPARHKCGRLHGHSYALTVIIEGEPDEKGMLMEFEEIDQKVQPILDTICHTLLNDTIENPTCENMAVYLLNKMPFAGGVVLSESTRSKCEVWR